MKVVVDTNILFSSLLSERSALRDILLERDYHFFAPNYLFVELFRYKDKIQRYGKLDEEELYEFLHAITERIQFIRLDFISIESRQQAYDFCKDVDVKDTVFVALCLELGAVLWTGDKKLKKHLSEKGFQQIFEP